MNNNDKLTYTFDPPLRQLGIEVASYSIGPKTISSTLFIKANPGDLSPKQLHAAAKRRCDYIEKYLHMEWGLPLGPWHHKVHIVFITPPDNPLHLIPS